MSEDLAGEGQALEPGVSFEPAAPSEDAVAEASRVVEAAEQKVVKQREHLAGAEQALEAAKAARDAIGGAA